MPRRSRTQSQLLQLHLGSFIERSRELLPIQEVMLGAGRVGLRVSLVILCRRRQMLGRGVAQRCRLVQKNDRPQGALR